MDKITFHGETQFMCMGYSKREGPWVKFRVENISDLLQFEGLEGERGMMAWQQVDNSEQPVQKPTDKVVQAMVDGELVEGEQVYDPRIREHGTFARHLLLDGVFNQDLVMLACGTDQMFQAWVKEQPSCLSGSPCEEYHHINVKPGEGHAGKGKKYPYSGVPLTKAEHDLVHMGGRVKALQQFGKRIPVNPSAAKDWFEDKAAWYRWRWGTERVMDWANEVRPGGSPPFTSRAEMPPKVWRAWFAMKKLTIPPQFREGGKYDTEDA